MKKGRNWRRVLETEVKSAIKALSSAKTPGEDGYSLEFYKSFQDTLAPFLIMLYNDVISKQSMPMTMRSAIISLIPKLGKGHSQMSNFRPLSLLNNDYKLFAKILATRWYIWTRSASFEAALPPIIGGDSSM